MAETISYKCECGAENECTVPTTPGARDTHVCKCGLRSAVCLGAEAPVVEPVPETPKAPPVPEPSKEKRAEAEDKAKAKAESDAAKLAARTAPPVPEPPVEKRPTFEGTEQRI